MTAPEEALALARRRAARARAEGRFADADLRADGVPPAGAVGVERLLEWALIEPDPGEVRSTRRLAGPAVTAAKRGLVRALRQHLGQLAAQQTRFNHHAVLSTAALEDRVARLEARIAELEAERGR